MIGPSGGDALGAFWAAAMQQHHLGVFGPDFVEAVPDRAMIVEADATRERDLRSSWEQWLRLGVALSG